MGRRTRYGATRSWAHPEGIWSNQANTLSRNDAGAPRSRWSWRLYGWQCLRAPGDYGWLDSLDLAIHETGHLVFAFGGETLTLLGGTLFQLLVPAAFVVALWRQGDRHGATVPLWWLGQNCWNISVYIKDAQAQVLPLVGGGEHDWAILLDQWGWLERDQAIGRAVFLLGVVLYGTALVAGWFLLYPRPRQQVTDPRIQPTNAR